MLRKAVLGVQQNPERTMPTLQRAATIESECVLVRTGIPTVLLVVRTFLRRQLRFMPSPPPCALVPLLDVYRSSALQAFSAKFDPVCAAKDS